MKAKKYESELRKFAEDCNASAESLKKEVATGRCFRQSPESKMARVQVLECHRDWALNLLREASQ